MIDINNNTVQWINPKEHLSYQNHINIDTMPTDEDFKKVVAEYLAFRVSSILKGQASFDVSKCSDNEVETTDKVVDQ